MDGAVPDFPHSAITRDERGVYTLRIYEAKRLNILSTPVITGLTEAAQWIGAQSDARAVIIRGAGHHAFVGGANIFEMAELDAAGGHVFITRLRRLCEAVAYILVPTIARIPGFCLGGGRGP